MKLSRWVKLFVFVGLMTTFIAKAMDTPLPSGTTSAPSTTLTNFGYISFNNSTTWQVTASTRVSLMSGSFTVKNVRIKCSDPTNGGSSYTFVLRKNGVSTAISITISAGSTTGTDLVNQVSFVLGDDVKWMVYPSLGTAPAALANVYMTCICSGSTANQSPIFTGTANAIAAAPSTNYFGMAWDANVSSTNALRQASFPANGYFSNMVVRLDGAPTQAYNVGIVTNGVLTPLATGNFTSTDITNQVNSVSITAGTPVSMVAIAASGATARRVSVGIMFCPTTDGESVMLNNSANTQAANLTRYQNFPIGSTSGSSTETDRQVLMSACTLRALYCSESTVTLPLLSSQSISFTARNNVADTTLTSTITGDNASMTLNNSDLSHSVTIADGDMLSLKLITSATVAEAPRYMGGAVMFINPSTAADTDGDFFQLIP